MFHRDSFSTASFSEQSWKFDGVIPGTATGGFFYGLKGGRKRGQEVDEDRKIEDAVDVAAQLLPIAKANRPRAYDLRALLPSPVQAKSTLEGTGLPLAISFAFSADRRLTDDEAIALVLLMAEV